MPIPVDPADRARLLAALHAARMGVSAATITDAEQADDAAAWAERMIEELRQIRRDLEWAQDRVAWIGNQVGVSHRTIARAAGVSAATPRTWIKRGTENPTLPTGIAWHQGDDDDLARCWDAAGIPGEIQAIVASEIDHTGPWLTAEADAEPTDQLFT